MPFKPWDRGSEGDGHELSSTSEARGRKDSSLKDLESQQHDPDRGSRSEPDMEIVAKQIELEKDNAIKYRTCSWQKA